MDSRRGIQGNGNGAAEKGGEAAEEEERVTNEGKKEGDGAGLLTSSGNSSSNVVVVGGDDVLLDGEIAVSVSQMQEAEKFDSDAGGAGSECRPRWSPPH